MGAPRSMDLKEAQQLVEDLEPKIERLKSLYQQYFMGIEKIPPHVLRKDVERSIFRMRRSKLQNTRLRFKFQQLVQRYNTYDQYWSRIMRQIEKGTFKRDLRRAAKRFGQAEALTIAGRKAQAALKGLDDDEAAPAPEPGPPVYELPDPSGFEIELDLVEDDVPTPPARPAPTAYDQRPVWDPSELYAGSSRPPASTGSPHPAHPLAAPPAEPTRPGNPPPPPSGPRVSHPSHHPVPRTLGRPLPPPAPRPAPGGHHGSAARPPPTRPLAPPPPPPTTGGASGRAPAGQALFGRARPAPAVSGSPPQRSPRTPAEGARPSPPAPRASPPAPRSAQPRAASTGGDGATEAAKTRAVYDAYVAARVRTGRGANVSYDSMRASLERQAAQLRKQHGRNRRVDFEVVERDGKPLIRPVVK